MVFFKRKKTTAVLFFGIYISFAFHSNVEAFSTFRPPLSLKNNFASHPTPIKLQFHASSSTHLKSVSEANKSIEAVDTNGNIETTSPVTSTLYLIAMDVALRKAFKKASIAFPSSLAGCGVLFAAFLTVNQINPEQGDKFYNTLSPGAGVLAKWLPVFFVPSLVTLPLAPSMGSAAELAKIAFVLVSGFYFTLLTTAWSVMAVRKIGGGGDVSTDVPATEIESTENSDKPPPKKFSDATFHALTKSTLTTGVLATLAARTGANTLSTSLQSLFMLFTTLSTFVYGARLPSNFTKIVHPLVICTGFTWIGAKVMSVLVGGASSFTSMLKAYKIGSLSPFHTTGAGDVLLFMLGPAVVALACQMYNRKTLMKENIKEVGTAVVGSSVGGLFGTAALVRVMKLTNPLIRLSALSRNITSPLAMAIASMLQADVSLAVSMVVISGLAGANFGAMILDTFKVNDPVARGLGIGAASHGLGTAAFANEKDAFPFAAIAMALTASFSTVLVSIPAVKKALIKLALG